MITALLLALALLAAPTSSPQVTSATPVPNASLVPESLRLHELSYLTPPFRDCGLRRLNSSDPSVISCALEAWNSGRPFVARIQRLGVDSHVVDSFLAAKPTQLIQLVYDSNVCGAPNTGKGCGERVFEYFCTGGLQEPKSSEGPILKCAQRRRQDRN
jgi:hypothetical protein